MKLYVAKLETPFGPVAIGVDADGTLVSIVILPYRGRSDAAAAAGPGDEVAVESADEIAVGPARTARVAAELGEYFAGRRRRFDLPLAPFGTPFQQQVWRAMLAIPYGETRTYSGLAAEIGRPGAARAVGRASGTNPIPIVIPCHRVLGADGSLTGFGGGLAWKAGLLALERGGQLPLTLP